MQDNWTPTLEDGPESLYARLADALERDVETGVLEGGTRLPPQRTLASRLGLSVGTVTKAYLEAERRGLVIGHVGRGTFVAQEAALEEGAEAGQVVDLSVNVIPHQAAARRFGDSMAALRRRPDALEAMAYAPPTGTERARIAAREWISEVAGLDVDPSRLILTSGAQQAMALAFGLLCKRGDTVLCEDATFYGMKSLAEHSDLSIHGVAMDEEGVIPDELEGAARKTGARVVYLMPTVHNPTARTMSKNRRTDLVKTIRKLKMWVVEDDNYALYSSNPKDTPTLASLAPEQVVYLGGVSKSIAPGLRFGYLHCPTGDMVESVVRAVRSTVYAPSGLGGLFFSDWVDDRSAFDIAEVVKREIRARAAATREILGPAVDANFVDAPHIWLPMDELAAERLAGRALRAGVALTPPNAPVPPGGRALGIRLCIGAAANLSQLTIGLERLRSVLAAEDVGAAMEMV
ncbi:MAG TPA: PLP-dependent aminotransferase family protein [Sphingomicrobium sp.]|nr:PLP-dependent aminotransferase family protein [Sphingomicrobium sp.]